MIPTGAAQMTQSRCRFPNLLNHFHAGGYIGGSDRPRLLTAFTAGAFAGGALGCCSGVVSTSNRSFGVHSKAVHNAIRVDSLTWLGSLVSSADTEAAEISNPAF